MPVRIEALTHAQEFQPALWISDISSLSLQLYKQISYNKSLNIYLPLVYFYDQVLTCTDFGARSGMLL